MSSLVPVYEYDVCLSFAGEQRRYVEDVAAMLRGRGLRIFYDGYERATLWGKDLYERLDSVYSSAAHYCVLFISAEYASKIWTSHERRSAQARALRENVEYILPARFDDTELPGLRETIAYVDLRVTSISELVDLITAKVRSRTSQVAETQRSGGWAADGIPERVSAEGAARKEFRELRARHRLSIGVSDSATFTSVSHAPAGTVVCPVCLCMIDWGQVRETLFCWNDNQGCYLSMSSQPGESERHWQQRAANAMVRCPLESSWFSGLEHYLPALYGAYGEPIIIAAVGQTKSGKTHLLTMIGAELEKSAALRGELSFHSLDDWLGERFREEYVKPLVEERRVLSATAEGDVNFFQAWRGYNHRTGRPFVLAFFDCAGGELTGSYDMPRFLYVADAILFLADAEALPYQAGDGTVEYVMDSIDRRVLGAVPAAVVITKSDLLEAPEASQWLSRHDESDLSTIEQESEEAFTFLRMNAGPGWLRPTRTLPLTTLHFTSATGTSANPRTLMFDEHLFGPRRVLRPLLALLKAIGVVERAQFTDPRGGRGQLGAK